jgi:hypothetical protein
VYNLGRGLQIQSQKLSNNERMALTMEHLLNLFVGLLLVQSSFAAAGLLNQLNPNLNFCKVGLGYLDLLKEHKLDLMELKEKLLLVMFLVLAIMV